MYSYIYTHHLVSPPYLSPSTDIIWTARRTCHRVVAPVIPIPELLQLAGQSLPDLDEHHHAVTAGRRPLLSAQRDEPVTVAELQVSTQLLQRCLAERTLRRRCQR